MNGSDTTSGNYIHSCDSSKDKESVKNKGAQLLDVDYTLRICRASSYEEKMLEERGVLFELVTNKGVKYVELTYAELTDLFHGLNEAQKEIDKLLC
ncbi:hypothetical protein AB6A40_002315 [Gnathostoma spinigerum]|uniref:COMM domain-containing protein n=1 Tax=Gnathostoma spinigerum TaxID=75299 RepID=A0ABD6E7K8_9BILA